MRRVVNYKVRKESSDDMNKAGRWNPCLEITFQDRKGTHTHKLGAGHHDVLDIYREGSITYVLSHHTGLGYFGLQAFDGDQEIGDVFIEAHQVKETIGRDDLEPYNTIKRLAEYLPY